MVNMVSLNKSETSHTGLTARLVAGGILSPDQSIETQKATRSRDRSLIRHLIDTVKIDTKALAEVASVEYGIPVFDVSAMNRDLLPDHQIDSDMMIKHHAVPLFRRGNRLFVAVSDPMNLAALNEFKFAAGMNTDAVLADDAALTQLINDIAEGSSGLERDMLPLAQTASTIWRSALAQ